MAGTPSELLGDVAYRIPPLTDSDAADLVRDLRASPLFFGYKGSEAIDVPAVEELIQRLARLKDDLPEVGQLNLGLVMAGAEGMEVLRASGRISPLHNGPQRLVHPPARRTFRDRRHPRQLALARDLRAPPRELRGVCCLAHVDNNRLPAIRGRVRPCARGGGG